MERITSQIPVEALASLNDQIARLAKRAKRLKVPAPRLTEEERITESVSVHRTSGTHARDAGKLAAEEPGGYIRADRTFVRVTIEGERPKLPGDWRFLASVEWVTTDIGAEPIFRAMPGVEIPAELRDAHERCDHCQVRRARKHLILVQSRVDERTMLVGSSCVADFLPGVTVAQILRQAECLDDAIKALQTGGGGPMCGPHTVDTVDHFLGTVAQIVRETGRWRSRTKARELSERAQMEGWRIQRFDATVDLVLRRYACKAATCGHKVYEQDVCERNAPTPTAADLAFGERAFLAIMDKRDEGDFLAVSDYEHNLFTACAAGFVTERRAGLVASALSYAERLLGERYGRQDNSRQAGKNEHIGRAGKRDTFRVTVHRKIEREGDYGLTIIHIMSDDEGRDLVWFATANAARKAALQEGETAEVKATVKRHNERDGRKQTIVNRVARAA